MSQASVPPMLRIRGLRKSFGKNVVLSHIDLEVAPGECIVMLGASGSGKSTLLRCIDLLEQVDDGVIELDGVDISDPAIDADSTRASMGIVFQAYNLFPHLTVAENIMLTPRHVHGWGRKKARKAAEEMLDRVGLVDKADSRPDDLSGGQQQRVAIARAMVNHPKVLLLDEITAALDPELVGEVLDLLTSLKNSGMTMVVSTHEMGFARRVADRVCFLDSGQIVESGPPREVIDNPQEERTKQFFSRLVE